MRKNIKKLMTVIIITALLAAVLCIPSSAVNNRVYDYYVVLGDSIPSGTGLEDAYGAALYDKTDKTIHGYMGTLTTDSYPALLNKELLCDEYYFGSRPGMRTTELRYLLEEDFATSADGIEDARYHEYFASSYAESAVANDLAERAVSGEYVDNVKNADLITVNIGSNDIWLPILCDITAYYSENLSGENQKAMMDAIKKAVNNYEDGFERVDSIFETAETLGEYSTILRICSESVTEAEKRFQRDWDAVIKTIRSYNDDADIIAIGLYNPMEDYISEIESKILGSSLNTFFESLFNRMSRYIHYSSPYHLQYTYVDVAEVGEMVVSGKTSDGMHPNQEGHRKIFDKVLYAVENICRHWEWTEEEIEENTELSGYVAHTLKQPGYSGDRVCKHCGEVIEQGYVTTALGINIKLPDNFIASIVTIINNIFEKIAEIFKNLFPTV